jgi:RNA ligase (TIGR02306 family)
MFTVPCVTVNTVEKHPNADTLDIITFNEIGWTCIDKIDTRKVGDKVIYIPIDSVVPLDRPEFSFLRERAGDNDVFRVKTIKLRQVYSQGLIIDAPTSARVGEDFCEYFGITKYISKEESGLNNPTGGSRFPSWLQKTDAERYQNVNRILENNPDLLWFKSTKMDGTSGTFAIDKLEDEDKRKIICSRNLNISGSKFGRYFDKEKKYDLHTKLLLMSSLHDLTDKYGNIEKIAVQGEICGPGIQKNRMKHTELQFHAFDIFIVSDKFVGYINAEEFISLCKKYDIPTVPIIDVNCKLPNVVDAQEDANNAEYSAHIPAEGYVYVEMNNVSIRGIGRAKIKIISQKYDLKS